MYDADTDGNGGFVGQDPPPAGNNGWGSVYDAVAGMLRSALGHEPDPAQVHQWADGRSPDELASIQTNIYNTDEAKAWGSRFANKPIDPGPGPGPLDPGPGPGPGPGSSAVPSGPAPSAPSSAPAPSMPNVPHAPAFQPPPDFTYDTFSGPTKEDVLNDPDYQLTRDQGIQAIGHKNAALGTLNTGGTIGDYVGFASNLAHAKYGDLYNRQKSTYDTNRAGAFDAWKANYGVSKDTYDTNYSTQYKDPFSEGMQQSQLSQNNNQFNAQLGQNNNQFNSTFDFQKWLENYKRDVTDPFEMKYRAIGLL